MCIQYWIQHYCIVFIVCSSVESLSLYNIHLFTKAPHRELSGALLIFLTGCSGTSEMELFTSSLPFTTRGPHCFLTYIDNKPDTHYRLIHYFITCVPIKTHPRCNLTSERNNYRTKAPDPPSASIHSTHKHTSRLPPLLLPHHLRTDSAHSPRSKYFDSSLSQTGFFRKCYE